MEGLEGARNPPPSGHSDQHLPSCTIVPPRPSSQESCPPRGAQGFTNTMYLLPASPHPSLSHPPQRPLEHSPRGNQSKLRGKTEQATSAFVPTCVPVGPTTIRHKASLPAPPASRHFARVFRMARGVGHMWVHCVLLDCLYCTSLLSLSWFSSLLLENGINSLKITHSQHQPPSSALKAHRPLPALWPLGASPHLLPRRRWPRVGASPSQPILFLLSLLHVHGHSSLAGLSAHTVVTLMTSSRLPPCGVRCS